MLQYLSFRSRTFRVTIREHQPQPILSSLLVLALTQVLTFTMPSPPQSPTTSSPSTSSKSSTTSNTPSHSPLTATALHNKYPLLILSYISLTSLFFYRISRQPFSRSIKLEHAESVFKATTLAAVLGGVGLGKIG